MKKILLFLVSVALLSSCNLIGKKIGKAVAEEEGEHVFKTGSKEVVEDNFGKGSKEIFKNGVEDVSKANLKEGILGKAENSITRKLSVGARRAISYGRLPKGKWSGKPGESFWLPDNLDEVPKFKVYSGGDKSWRQLLKEYHCPKGIPFKNGEPDFKAAGLVKGEVDLGDIGQYLKIYTNGKVERKYLHEEAFRRLAKKWNMSVDEVKAFKEKNNLVWHESADGHTLELVPREIHDHVAHAGGVAMWKASKAAA